MKELIEKKNDLITRAEKVLAVAKEEKRELTPEEAQELKEIKAKVDMIAETIKLDEDVKEMAKEDMEKKEDYTPTEEGEKMKKEETNNVAEQETRAFENYIRGYVVNERAGELTKADNGAVIPTSIANKIIKKVYDICPILEQSTKYNVKGNLDLPYYDADTRNITVA